MKPPHTHYVKINRTTQNSSIMKKIITLSLLLFISLTILSAQQTSKSKAAKKLYEKGGQIELFNATAINTGQFEFSPAFYQNGIVFATSQKSEGDIDKNTGATFFDLFYADRDAEGLPLAPQEFAVRISSKKHEGPVAFSRDGQKIFFTQNNVTQKEAKPVVRLKIYEASKTSRDWDNVKELPFNSDEYSTCHPTLTPDGQTLYFASDMPGGIGGMDLWMVKKNGNTWSAPVNLGAKVNTPYNEVFPFVHSSGNLFFASNGYEGEGGLDLYMATFENDPKGQVASLGDPFNTEADDLGLILNPEGNMGFFTSSRSGGQGKDDIYMFKAPEGIWGRTKPNEFMPTIAIFDKTTKDPIEGASIRVFERTADGFVDTSNDLYEAVLIPAKEGAEELNFKLVRKNITDLNEPDSRSDEMGKTTFSFFGERTYILLVTKDGYKDQEVNYSTIGNTGKLAISAPMEKIKSVDNPSAPEKITPPETAIPETDNVAAGTVIVLENIYYDFNKSAIRSGAARELDEVYTLMQRNPDMEIELIAHTDSRGSEKYNLKLSQNRANSARNYLISRGIDASRITATGLGESQIRNHCKDNIKCSQQDHQFNRRTEIKIIR